jgi:hypothetical protein
MKLDLLIHSIARVTITNGAWANGCNRLSRVWASIFPTKCCRSSASSSATAREFQCRDRLATGGRDGFEPSVPRLRSLAEFVKPRSPPRPFRAGGVGRARAPSDSPRTKPSLPSRATFKISREDRDRSGQNSGREWDSLIKPETSLIADLNSLQGRIIFVRMRRELASNRFGIEVIPAFRGEKVSERVAVE